MKIFFLILTLASCSPALYPKTHGICLRNLDICSQAYGHQDSFVCKGNACVLVPLQDWNNLCAEDFQHCENNQ